MSHSADDLLVLAEDFERMATESLVKSAKAKSKKDKDPKAKKKFPFWLNKKKNTNDNSSDGSDGENGSDSASAKDGKKKPPFWMKNKDLGDANDPKAKVRNRGTVCVPAENAKDKKDHFPINDEAQARNALARVNQFSSVPDWYSGSLQSLINTVTRKVHSKYPGIKQSPASKKPGKG